MSSLRFIHIFMLQQFHMEVAIELAAPTQKTGRTTMWGQSIHTSINTKLNIMGPATKGHFNKNGLKCMYNRLQWIDTCTNFLKLVISWLTKCWNWFYHTELMCWLSKYIMCTANMGRLQLEHSGNMGRLE